VGASVLGAGGAATGGFWNETQNAKRAAIGGAAGVAVGALTGYTVCAMMPEAAPPPPPPPPPPVAKAAPTVKKTVVLPGVTFAFNKSDLLPGAKEILDREVIPELKADTALQVVIEGHTDSVGSDEYNMKLSGQRAGAVWKYLVSKGIDSSRLQAKGLGESMPIASNDTEEGRAKNRRVEIKELK
jgi:outer membrane protein OmpA-like peptidoglycan-associated protein